MFIPIGDDVDHREFSILGIVLLAANVTAFLYVLQEFPGPNLANREAFFRDWGLVPAALRQGYLPGLFTHMFLHGDVFHLAGNMFCLWAFVQTLEGCLGVVRFCIFYVLWGVVAGLAHAATGWDSQVPLIGASGAIAGMMGAYIVAFGLFTHIRALVFFVGVFVVEIPACAFMIFWMAANLMGASSEPEAAGGGVAWYAHFGGFAAGALTMLVFKRTTLQNVSFTDDGKLEVRRGAGIALEDVPTEIEAPPAECPHCHTPLDETNRLAGNLLRCPNPSCHRCIYLEEVPVAPAPDR